MSAAPAAAQTAADTHALRNATLTATETSRTISYTYDGLLRLTDATEDPGTVYRYTYDLAGNRTAAWENGAPIQQLRYNAANQVIGWSYDAAGNLLSDGTTTYAYDALHRLTQQNGTTNAYNGDGVLVAAGATSYAQDLVTPLSQVLNDGSANYLYGHARLAALDGPWYVGDTLDSVRQTLDSRGAVLAATDYDPWGTPQTPAVAPFGFTGELQNDDLVHLRARWYAPSTGTFTARDPFAGFAEMPYSLHPYQYAYSAPTTWVDPSGFVVTNNPRDLTDWLFREMTANAVDPRTVQINQQNAGALAFMAVALVSTGVGFVNPLAFAPALIAGGGAGYLMVNAANDFRLLVKDRAVWDFKHMIEERLGPGITLCGAGSCRDDIEYSVPGNIHYGYVAKAAGYWDITTNVGAGVAEIFDPSHAEAADADLVGYTGTVTFQFNPFTNNWGLGFVVAGDELSDSYAVSFGMYLYRVYGRHMTSDQFQRELDRALPGLATHAPAPNPVQPDIACDWPYPVGYFDPTKGGE